jgi:hypothetical protein
MDKLKKLFVLVLIVGIVSLVLTGCKEHEEHPTGEHPSSSEHPSGEKSAEEHPAGEHPTEKAAPQEHPAGEHPE